MASAPPSIFSKRRKYARRSRAAAMRDSGETTNFLLDEMADDIHERLAFLRHQPTRVLVEGYDVTGVERGRWEGDVSFDSTRWRDFDEPLTCTSESYDLVVSVNSLDTVNDLPGALIQMRELLVPGGLAIASFVGGTSLSKLRRAMFDADPDRPAARMHPLVDPRSCPQLLARAGWKSPVVDSHVMKVRYGSLDRLVQDLREQALGNVLDNYAPPLTRAAAERARRAFLAQADEDGRVTESFEILTLTGWR